MGMGKIGSVLMSLSYHCPMFCCIILCCSLPEYQHPHTHQNHLFWDDKLTMLPHAQTRVCCRSNIHPLHQIQNPYPPTDKSGEWKRERGDRMFVIGLVCVVMAAFIVQMYGNMMTVYVCMYVCMCTCMYESVRVCMN